MIKNLQIYLLVILALRCLVTAYLIKPASSLQRTLTLFPPSSLNCLKEKRTSGRNGKSLLYNNFNNISEEDISSSILEVPLAAQSASNIPLEQGNYRQGRIYKLYQYFISCIMNTSIWREYSLSLSMKPLVTKAFSSMIGYFLGDILAQVIFRKVSNLSIFVNIQYAADMQRLKTVVILNGIKLSFFQIESNVILPSLANLNSIYTFSDCFFYFLQGGFNFTRLLRMGAFGGIFHGPTGHLFYGLLERKFPGASTSAVVKKVIAVVFLGSAFHN